MNQLWFLKLSNSVENRVYHRIWWCLLLELTMFPYSFSLKKVKARNFWRVSTLHKWLMRLLDLRKSWKKHTHTHTCWLGMITTFSEKRVPHSVHYSQGIPLNSERVRHQFPKIPKDFCKNSYISISPQPKSGKCEWNTIQIPWKCA